MTALCLLRKVVSGALGGVLLATPVATQSDRAAHTTAIRAGRLFDSKTGAILRNQVVLVSGERITEVGASGRVRIPADAAQIDLGNATLMPGLIDGHVHVMGGTVAPGEAGLQQMLLIGVVC
jgi:imidazolonepropionase-like amidohydrolase